MKKILLVEDEVSLGQTLTERLEREGYAVSWARSAKAAELFFDIKHDVIIMDLGLPDGHGFEVARKVKAVQNTPFLFVTAQSDAKTRLEGFELGAEEFIPKPFHIKELLMRVKHVIDNHSVYEKIHFENFAVDFRAMQIQFSNAEVAQLPLRDFQVLKLLIDKRPAVVSRDEILNIVWGESEFPSNRTIDNIIVRLRQSLKDSNAECIKSIRGVGYQWLLEK